MTSMSLESFKDCLGSISLDIFAINNNLDNSVPDFFRDIVTSKSDEIENDIDIPERVKVFNSKFFLD